MTIAEQYNNFQHSFGQGEEKNFDEIIGELFEPGFKKVANGKELVSGSDKLHAQLIEVVDMAGKFAVKPVQILEATDGNHFTNRYILETEKAGNFHVIAVMTIGENSKISLIDEIYYQPE